MKTLRCWRMAGRERRSRREPDTPRRRDRPTRGADRAVRAAAIPALPKPWSACLVGQCGLHLETRSPTACRERAREGWKRSSRGNFFESLLSLRIALGMLRPDRKPHIAQGPELFANRAFVEPYAKHLRDAQLEISTPPSHDAIFFTSGPCSTRAASSVFCAGLSRDGRPGPLRFSSPAKPSAL